MFDLSLSWRLLLVDRTLGKVWTLCFHTLIWAIWKGHNNRVFDSITGDLSSVWDSFLFLFASWVKKDCIFSSYSFFAL